MPIEPYKRPSGIYHLRGTHHGISVDRSAKTRDKSAAWKVAERVEREIFDAVVLGKVPDRSFAEAAIEYMNSGGDRAVLAPILAAEIAETGDPRDVSRKLFADWLLKKIDQGTVNRVAMTVYPEGTAQDSTRNRKIYTPIAAVLNFAAEQPSWNYSAFRIRRPEEPKGRIDWRRPAEIEWWLERAGDIAPLIAAYVGTGARASELINLEWPNVTPGQQRISLWEDDTKADTARWVDLQTRVREVFPKAPSSGRGRVFTQPDSVAGWSSYAVINRRLDKISERETLKKADRAEYAELKPLRAAMHRKSLDWDARTVAATAYRERLDKVRLRVEVPTIHLHIFRHTWATWAYAVTRDFTFLMPQGGWASEALVLRYAHGGSDDIKDEVHDYGWEMRPGAGIPPARTNGKRRVAGLRAG